jgi:hypothetical protein
VHFSQPVSSRGRPSRNRFTGKYLQAEGSIAGASTSLRKCTVGCPARYEASWPSQPTSILSGRTFASESPDSVSRCRGFRLSRPGWDRPARRRPGRRRGGRWIRWRGFRLVGRITQGEGWLRLVRHPRVPHLAPDYASLLVRNGVDSHALFLLARLSPELFEPRYQAIYWGTLARSAAGAGNRREYESSWMQLRNVPDAAPPAGARLAELSRLFIQRVGRQASTRRHCPGRR